MRKLLQILCIVPFVFTLLVLSVLLIVIATLIYLLICVVQFSDWWINSVYGLKSNTVETLKDKVKLLM